MIKLREIITATTCTFTNTKINVCVFTNKGQWYAGEKTLFDTTGTEKKNKTKQNKNKQKQNSADPDNKLKFSCQLFSQFTVPNHARQMIQYSNKQ